MSTSDGTDPASAGRYPLGAWALALIFIGPLVVISLVTLISLVIYSTATGWERFGGLDAAVVVVPVCFALLLPTAIVLAIVDLARGDGSGHSAARVTLVLAGIWILVIGVASWLLNGVHWWG